MTLRSSALRVTPNMLKTRRDTFSPMPNYRRAFVSGGCWFFTVNVLERKGSLLVDHIDQLRESVTRTRRQAMRTFQQVATYQGYLCKVVAETGKTGRRAQGTQ
jgi:hypothetical protein